MDLIETTFVSLAVAIGCAVFALRIIRDKAINYYDDIDWEP